VIEGGTPLRCFCSTRPILAVVKKDSFNAPFVHIKSYKQRRIFTEIVFNKGEMRVRCRDCFRWHKIRILKEKAVLEELPDEEDIVDLVPDPY